MAEFMPAKEKSLLEELEITCCPLCLEQFTELKMLPCDHCCCKKCILKLALGLRTQSGKIFHCPICHYEVTIPEGGVDNLQTAFSLNRLILIEDKTLQRTHGNVGVKCELCTASSDAEAFCRQCSCFICSECVQLHSKLRPFIIHEVALMKALEHGRAAQFNPRTTYKKQRTLEQHKQVLVEDATSFQEKVKKLSQQKKTLLLTSAELLHIVDSTERCVSFSTDKDMGLEELKREITCSICCEHYTEPKVLPCLHYYCKKCIIKLMPRTGSDQPLRCPECRSEATLSKGGVDNFKTAFFSERLKSKLTALQRALGKVEVKCELCTASSNAEAFCRQCSCFICSECVQLHSKLRSFIIHEVAFIEDPKHSHKKEPPTVNCEVHKKPIIIFCYDCSHLICQHCTLKDHVTHNYEFTKKAAHDIETKLLKEIHLLTSLEKEVTKAGEKIQATSPEIEVKKQASVDLEQQEHKLVADTAKISQEKTKISQQKKTLSLASAELTSAVSYIQQFLTLPTDNELNLEELESEITCVICQEHYTQPKVLPCLHYYCKKCIVKLTLRTQSGQPFRCPECRSEATLPEGGVDNLKTAFFVERLKSTITTLQKEHSKMEAKWDEEEKSRIQASLLEGVDRDKEKSKLLESYPLLPTSLMEVAELADTPSGFSAKKAISVSYKGEKGSVMWKEGGLYMWFEENKQCKSEEATEIVIRVSDIVGQYSTLPRQTEVVSQVYFISSAKKLNTSVTLKMLHCAKDKDIDKLSFLTCRIHEPPCVYRFLSGGNFTSSYGEITVQRFSFITISRFLFQHGLKGILYYLEKSYEAALHYSAQPKQIGSDLKWNLYLCVTKNCRVFRSYLKEYIEEQHHDHIQLCSANVARFNDTDDCISASVNCQVLENARVYEPDTAIMHKTDIKRYVDGCPPLLYIISWQNQTAI